MNPAETPFITRLLDLEGAPQAIRVAVLLAVALGAVLLARAASPRARHGLLATTFILVLCLPLFSSLAPSWTVAVLPARTVQVDPSSTGIGNAPGPLRAADDLAAGGTPRLPVAGTTDRGSAPLRVANRSSASILLLIWAVVASLLALRALGGLARTRSLLRRTRPASATMTRLARQLAARIGVRTPRIRSSAETATPFVFGVIRPTLVLPADAEGWSRLQAKMVLAHELAHVRGRDWSCRQLAGLCRILHWFDPLVWIAARRLTLESERACDQVVLEQGGSAPDYAAFLLALARKAGSRRELAAAVGAVRSGGLEQRIRLLLESSGRRGRGTGLWSLPLVTSLLVAGASAGPGRTPAAIAAEAAALQAVNEDSGSDPSLAPEVSTILLDVHAGSIRITRGRAFEVRGRLRADSADVRRTLDDLLSVETVGRELRVLDLQRSAAIPNVENRPWSLDLDVCLPRGLGLQARIGSGTVELQAPDSAFDDVDISCDNGTIHIDVAHVRGAMRVHSGRGEISISLRDGGVGAPSTVHNGNGGIRLAFSPDGRQQLRARTPLGLIRLALRGRVSADFDLRSDADGQLGFVASDPPASVDPSQPMISMHLGSVRIDGTDRMLTCKDMVLKRDAGAPELSVQASDGDIDLRLLD